MRLFLFAICLVVGATSCVAPARAPDEGVPAVASGANSDYCLLARYLDSKGLGHAVMIQYDTSDDAYEVTTSTTGRGVQPLTGGGHILRLRVANGQVVELSRTNWVG